jgi:hypothetical protein
MEDLRNPATDANRPGAGWRCRIGRHAWESHNTKDRGEWDECQRCGKTRNHRPPRSGPKMGLETGSGTPHG